MEGLKGRISLYLEIKDSDVFGGNGSIGYSEVSVEVFASSDSPDIFKESAYDTFSKMRKRIADDCGVSIDNVRTISKQEYEENTEE